MSTWKKFENRPQALGLSHAEANFLPFDILNALMDLNMISTNGIHSNFFFMVSVLILVDLIYFVFLFFHRYQTYNLVILTFYFFSVYSNNHCLVLKI